MEFRGTGRRLRDDDFERAARMLGCAAAAVQAVVEVESAGGGFLRDKRPKILFESRWFHKLTDGRFDTSHPHLSTPQWVRNYRGGSGEYDRLHEALELDRAAALKSASWGLFQILGVNHRLSGFHEVERFVDAMVGGEAEHLDAFVAFVIHQKIDDELRDQRWADFARRYNGPRYAEHGYHDRLAAAYLKHSDGVLAPSTRQVQQQLVAAGYDIAVDGITGPNTRAALVDFQSRQGLLADGIAGPETWAALGLDLQGDPVMLAGRLAGDGDAA